MNFLKKYWYLFVVAIITVGIGVVAYLTSIKLEQKTSVAPNVPQVTPKAANSSCKVVFSVPQNTPTPTIKPTNTPTPRPTNTPTPTRVPTSTPTGVYHSPTPTSTPRPTNTPTPTPTGVYNSPTPTSTPIPTNTPTPTPTNVPNTPTPTPTGVYNSPTPTPIGYTPECTNLTLSPASGTPPFTTTLTCSGTIQGGDITAAEFTLPDGTTKLVEENVGSPGSISYDYTVSQAGSVSFSCRVRDNNGTFSTVPAVCRRSIGPTPTVGPTPTTSLLAPEIPVTGTGPSLLGIATIVGGILLLLFGLAF